jgi:hypothetical protein
MIRTANRISALPKVPAPQPAPKRGLWLDGSGTDEQRGPPPAEFKFSALRLTPSKP